MAKKVKSTEVRIRARSRELRHALHMAGVLAFVAVLGYGVALSKRYADAHVLTPATPPAVVIVNPPTWMNDALRQRIEGMATPVSQRSSLDGSQVKEIAEILAVDPWVKTVNQVRRSFGQSAGDTIEVDCEFRAPLALVQDEGFFWMVDGDGVKLPDRYQRTELAKVAMGQGLHGIQLRVITGVHAQAPQAGEHWQGEDLAAGIELVKLFHDKPYMSDVAMIDVNAIDPKSVPAARRRNEVVLHTIYNTQIRWGEPVTRAAFSVDVPAGQKLLTLERLYKEYGRIDARHPWLSIRYDTVLYPDDTSQSATTDVP